MQNRGQTALIILTGAYGLEGGIAAANRLVLQALADSGYTLHIIAFNETQGVRQRYNHLGRVRYTALASNKLGFVLQVWRAVLTHRYTLVFCDHVNLASILAPLSTLRGVRYVVRLNGIEVFSPLPDFQGQLGLRAAWRRIAISEYTRQQVIKSFPEMNIEVCDLALDPRQTADLSRTTSPERNDMKLTAVDGNSYQLGSQVILHVGRMATSEQYKGQDTLIKAMPTILQEFPQAQLVLAGKGDDAVRLLALARTYAPEIQAAILMPGYVPDVQLDMLYQTCFLFAMPSRGEGFGMVYIEAMRWGKPCLGSRVDAAQFIIRDQETGVLVDDPASPEGTATKILDLLRDPETARRYGQAGHDLAQNNYNYPSFRERWMSLLQEHATE